MNSSHNLSIGTLIIPSSALLETSFLTIFLISSPEKSTSKSDWYWIKPWIKGKSDDNVIHYQLMDTVLKRKLNMSLFSLKSVIVCCREKWCQTGNFSAIESNSIQY